MGEPAVQGFRLSPQQRHLWSLHREGSIYASQIVVLLNGDLDQRTLRRALASVVARHEVLRTTFRRRSGIKVPLQMIAEAAKAIWNEVKPGAGETLSSPQRLLEERSRLSLEEPGGSLLRATLVNMDRVRHALILTVPALCADSRSLGNLVAEIAEAYSQEGAGGSEEPVQFVQFSEWQHEVLEDPEGAVAR
ncbi:MAG TPA: condensation domain-containing protein, partial [Thermoanaerobaculia bacterium]|nr:condensation domain-containing protein [Thermoanaerobaculia bacterium]